MKRTTLAAITATLLLGSAFVAGCGGDKKKKTPESLCATIYKQRVEGPIKLFREAGPKNKDKFLAHCKGLPMDYLECESKDLMKMEPKEIKACRKHMSAHQGGLNDVLVLGEVKLKKKK